MFAKLILTTLVCSFLTSCSKIKTIEPTEIKYTDVLLFKGPPPKKGIKYAYPTARYEGFLVQRGNCLYLSSKLNSNENLKGIMWPWNYTKNIINNNLVIRTGSKINFARVGTFVKLGGGYAPRENIKMYNQCSKFKVNTVFGGYAPLELR